jgi:DNA-binding HxlR family transcriptional regulator
MLAELLQRITESGTVRPGELARKLGVSEALLEGMLADLERSGYLRRVEGCSQGGCPACPAAGSCSTRKGRVWVRTHK